MAAARVSAVGFDPNPDHLNTVAALLCLILRYRLNRDFTLRSALFITRTLFSHRPLQYTKLGDTGIVRPGSAKTRQPLDDIFVTVPLKTT